MALARRGICVCFSSIEGVSPETTRDTDAAVVRVARPNDAGWRLVEALRRLNLPVVVTAARAEIRDARKALDMGCAYLPKPFAVEQLVDTLQRLIPRAQIA